MRRRQCLAFLGGLVAVWPMGATAQSRSMPVIGFLYGQSADLSHLEVDKFREGLKDQDYVEGQNVAIEYRWGNNDTTKLSVLAADLVERRVALIFAASGFRSALAAKAASTTIPIVFITRLNPAENGFVASLNRPGGNATGVISYSRELMPKRLELLRELVGPTTKIAYLMNSVVPNIGDGAAKQIEDERSQASQLMPLVLNAGSEEEIATAFATAAKQGIGALLVAPNPFFLDRRNLLVALAAKYALPACFQPRAFVDAGGLMSYGPNRGLSFREGGVYAGRILKGANPAEMPILTPRSFDLVINLRTANALGLTIPSPLLLSADDLIK
jgi:putative ABC transport system substrate-binding protein